MKRSNENNYMNKNENNSTELSCTVTEIAEEKCIEEIEHLSWNIICQ